MHTRMACMEYSVTHCVQGHGSERNEFAPREIDVFRAMGVHVRFQQVAAGYAHSMFLTHSGKVST